MPSKPRRRPVRATAIPTLDAARRAARNRQFVALSVRDLLEAREAYHVHLTKMDNVVATAIGRYRFMADDDRGAGDHPRGSATPKTLRNSHVTERSWPCVLVFVDRWLDPRDFAKKFDDVVPPRLHLPDGRAIPTCVVCAEKHPLPTAPVTDLRFPGSYLGGGYPALADVQETEHLSTIGCLVSDGDSLFVLTDRHVAGEPGRSLYTLVNGVRERIGVSVDRQVGKLAFEKAYPGFAGRSLRANLDAALVRIDDATRWTSQVYGIGEFEELVDLNVDNVTLDLIGQPVCAQGAASGLMRGEIMALYYRYRSVGGVEYVADFLIGPREGAPWALSKPGNSGALWFLESPSSEDPNERNGSRRKDKPKPPFAPIALHWGGQRLQAAGGDGSEAMDFALASALSTICRELDVDVVRTHNTGLPETWGKVGHYKIGAAACRLPNETKLREFMMANLDRVAFTDADIADLPDALKRTKFVPLADVPDIVWKGSESKRGRESPNHFADMDEPSGSFGGQTLLDRTTTADKLTIDRWNDFYQSLGVEPMHRGLLPFRVWQLFDVMVAALENRTPSRFLAAAGVLAHYVGDACQPLHVSRLHDGDPDTHEGQGVHSEYETKMLDRFAAELNAGVNKALAHPGALPAISSGQDAGFAAVKLMKRSIQALPPKDIIDVYVDDDGTTRTKRMWNALGPRTIDRFADGATVLASIWQGAWTAGNGNAIAKSALKPIAKTTLRAIYDDRGFAPSVYLTMLRVENGRVIADPNA